MKKETLQQLNDYIEQLKTVTKQPVPNSHFLKIETYQCQLNNHHTIIRDKIVKNDCDGNAVIILPMTTENEVIVAIEPRVFTELSVGVDLPAGYVEKDEDSLLAAKRELLEETGYTSEHFTKLGIFYQDQGCSGARNTFFLATECYQVTNQKLDKDEYLKYMLVSLEDIEELIEQGYMAGANSVIAYEKSKTLLKRKGDFNE